MWVQIKMHQTMQMRKNEESAAISANANDFVKLERIS